MLGDAGGVVTTVILLNPEKEVDGKTSEAFGSAVPFILYSFPDAKFIPLESISPIVAPASTPEQNIIFFAAVIVAICKSPPLAKR